MTKIQKQGISSIIFLLIGLSIGFINSAILFPKTLGLVVFGFIRWIGSIQAIFSAIIGSSSSRIAVRFFPYFNDRTQKHHGFFTFIFSLSFLLSLVSIIFIFLFEDIISNQLSASKDTDLIQSYFYLLYIIITIATLQQGLGGYMIAIQKPRFTDFIAQIIIPLFVFVLLILYYCRIINQYLFLNIFAFKGFIMITAIIIYLIKYKMAFWSSFKPILKKQHLKPIFKYWTFTSLSGVSSIIIQKIDILMIASLLNFAQTGIYAIFHTIASVIRIPHNGMLRIINPIIAEAWRNKNIQKIENIYKQATLNNLIVGLLIFIGIWINIDSFILFMGEKYESGKYVALTIGLVQLLHVAFGYNGTILNHSPKYHFLLVSQFFALIVTITTNYLLIPIYGILGAAVATAATLLVTNIITQTFISFVFKIHPFSWGMLWALLLTIVLLTLNEFIPRIDLHFTIDFVVRSFVIGGLYIILVLGLKLSPDINGFLLKTYQKLRK